MSTQAAPCPIGRHRSLASARRIPRRGSFLALAVTLDFLSAPAVAGTVEGTVTFPGRTLPAATIYARNVTSGALHEAPIRRGETTFRMELPAGRYWLFMRPLEPGLLELYGGRTRFSECRDRPPSAGESSCTDHALLEIDVPASGAVAALHIDDWLLEEAQAQELDRILGPSPNLMVGAELGRPRFSEYRAVVAELPDTVRPAIQDDPRASTLGSQLASAAAAGPNFAGAFSLIRADCGEDCEQIAILDRATGTIHFPGQLGRVASAPPCRGERSLEFRDDSRLVEYTRREADSVVTDYLLWDIERRDFTILVQHRRSLDRYCLDPPPGM